MLRSGLVFGVTLLVFAGPPVTVVAQPLVDGNTPVPQQVAPEQEELADPTEATQEPQPGDQGNDLDAGKITEDPLGGLIVNRTMTVLGWDFYKSFSDVWQALHPDSKNTLTVVERPTAQFGSEIWINYLDQPVFHVFLSPARSQVRQVSKEAIEIVQQNIASIDIQRQFFKDADLGPEEM